MKQNGVIRNDEGIGVSYFKIEELESSILKARSQSRSRSFLTWDVGVGSWSRGKKSSTPPPWLAPILALHRVLYSSFALLANEVFFVDSAKCS